MTTEHECLQRINEDLREIHMQLHYHNESIKDLTKMTYWNTVVSAIYSGLLTGAIIYNVIF